MRFLHARELVPEPGERVFRHPRLAPLVLWALFALPLVIALRQHDELLATAGRLPWLAWFVVGPLALALGALYALLLALLHGTARKSLGRNNWVARVSPAGLVLNLRSYMNEHFPDDGPTIASFAWPEIVCVREVRDVTRRDERDTGFAPTRWLELELAPGLDTGTLAALVAHEREREAPETKRFGISARTRSGHVPVFVPAAGRVHLDWVGRGLLQACAAHATAAPRRVFDRAAAPPVDLDARLAELVRRGDELGAIRLLRQEEALSLRAAKERVEELARRAG